MTLLDASLLIDFLRTKDLLLLAQINSGGGAVCGVTRAEILSGARSTMDREKLITILDGFQQVSMPDPMWDDVGNVQAQLRTNGITIPLG
jgi:predicted nucleic acid-binding protein